MQSEFTVLFHKSAGSYGYHALVAVNKDRVRTTYVDMMNGNTWNMDLERREDAPEDTWYQDTYNNHVNLLELAGYMFVFVTHETGNLKINR